MNHKLGIFPKQAPIDKGHYQILVWRLIYLSHTRKAIIYEFMHAPSKKHINDVYQILRYLKNAPIKGDCSKNGSLNIEGYTYSNWVGDQTNRKSTSGYFTFVEGTLITWRSKKQILWQC